MMQFYVGVMTLILKVPLFLGVLHQGIAVFILLSTIFAFHWLLESFNKYSLNFWIELLVEGGIYIIDDMLPQPNWPEGHENNVTSLIQIIDSLKGYHVTKLNWATGIIMISWRSLWKLDMQEFLRMIKI